MDLSRFKVLFAMSSALLSYPFVSQILSHAEEPLSVQVMAVFLSIFKI